MSVIAFNQFVFDCLCPKLLIRVPTTVANTRFTSKRDKFSFTALTFIHGETFCRVTAIDNLANFEVDDVTDFACIFRVFRKIVPRISENIINANHDEIVTKNRL